MQDTPLRLDIALGHDILLLIRAQCHISSRHLGTQRHHRPVIFVPGSTEQLFLRFGPLTYRTEQIDFPTHRQITRSILGISVIGSLSPQITAITGLRPTGRKIHRRIETTLFHTPSRSGHTYAISGRQQIMVTVHRLLNQRVETSIVKFAPP